MRISKWMGLTTLAFAAFWSTSSVRGAESTWTTDTKDGTKTQVVKETQVVTKTEMVKEPSPAPEIPSPTTYLPDDWDIRIGVPLWAAGLNGDISVHNRSVHVSDNFTDILDTLDAIIALDLEARRNKWLFFMDGLYLKTSTSADRQGVLAGVNREAGLTSKTSFQDLGFGYELFGNSCARIEATLGTRIYHVHEHLSFSGPLGSFSDEQSKTWADGTVGMRAELSFAQRAALYFKGDVGAGGSDLTYQLEGGFDFTVKKHFYARLGYRYLNTDFSHGGFNFDTAIHGPQLELGARF